MKSLFFFILFVTTTKLLSCDCTGPDTFFKGIQKDSYVLHIKVLKNSKEKHYSINRSLYTVVEVLDYIKGKYIADTLLFGNDNGVGCGHSIAEYTLGTELIINSGIHKFSKHHMEDMYLNSTLLKKYIYGTGASACGVYLLHINRNNLIKGDIKKNKSRKFYRKYYRIRDKNWDKAEEFSKNFRYTKKYMDIYTVAELKALIRKKFGSL